MSELNAVHLHLTPGRAYPLGAAVRQSGVRFAVVSRHATRVWLALFDNAEDREPAFEVELEPERYRTGDVWSVYVEGLASGALYMYRMDGPLDPKAGHRFDKNVYLLDPYAKVIVGDIQARTAKCVAFGEKQDWVDDVRTRVPLDRLVIYETNVRGFSIGETSGVPHPGTYLGLIERIPHLKDLGVTAVELLPIQEFGETRLGRCSIASGKELHNYWGYSTIGFFAPTGRYAVEPGAQLDEFRRMVSALHQAGIEVILDVVFNHTSEGNQIGPTLCFRGLDNAIYYMLDEEGAYRNYSGCGNTLNCNHPLVRDFILDCLRYWVTVLHVDGFRFDLASILGRDTKGRIVENAGLIERIAEDPALRDAKLIAEAWDMGGAYQVGSFGDVRWAEWNGRYRDDVRRFWRGDEHARGDFATRLTGSSDLYQWAGRSPAHSINFVTAHDGFTLRDLVSYNQKHNRLNGEDNRDGLDDNISWNCGIEGETGDARIDALRLRMQKDYLATLFLSLGIPMMLGGDEFGRTQQGNNNAYCQDNPISWYDWRLLEKNAELFRFCKEMIRFRRENPVFGRLEFFEGKPVMDGGEPDIAWFDNSGEPVVWENDAPYLACRIGGVANDSIALYLMFNAARKDVSFRVPRGAWLMRINSSQPTPRDICDAKDAPTVEGRSLLVLPAKSLAVLSCKPNVEASD
ncbi:MAG: glycogen debranching protein GlgX [Candidatus Hydrogenedentes bacterium]|nr:glycogen debranching protein GlgX [Candidatus Hydrogenedentota bacterium]